MKKFVFFMTITASAFACHDHTSMAVRCMKVLNEEIKAAEDFFQDSDFSRANMIYEKAMTICYKLERGNYVPMSDEFKFLRFRAFIGQNLTEAFLKEEYDTMESRLQKVFESIK